MIQVFKTSVQQRSQVLLLKNNLDELVAKGKWNFDLYDCDNILRVQAPAYLSASVIELLASNGFTCEELPD